MRLFRFFLMAALCTPLSALAQYSIAKIVFTGGAPYTDAELLQVTGLQPGQMLSQSSLKNAAQHLVDTGLFDDAGVSSSGGSGKALTVNIALKPKPVAALLPVSLENFVWFTPEELTQGIHQAVPLFHGAVSDAGTMPDLIQAALEQMLAAKAVKATVSHIVTEPTSQHMVRVMDYKVEQPAVRIATVNLSIMSSSPEAVAAAKVTMPRGGLSYNEGLTGYTIEDFLLRAARNNGYITAKVDGLHREYTESSAVKGVTVTAKVVPGVAYKLAALNWEPTPVYSAAEFTHNAALRPGDVPQLYKLEGSENFILAAYHAQGYLDAYVDRAPQVDEAAHTVAYNMHAVPGGQYRLKSVTAVGLSTQARQEFDKAWRIKPGDVYDEAYVQKFVHSNTAMQNLAKYVGNYQIVADSETHLVDLTLTFSPNPHQ